MTKPVPSLASFERLVANRETAEAVREALRILQSIDNTLGSINGIDFGVPMPGVSEKDMHTRFATRFSATIGDLLTQPNGTFEASSLEMLFVLHRWWDMMFALGGFQTSAHLLARFTNGPASQWQLSGPALIQFLLIFSPSSTLDIDLEECFGANAGVTVVAVLAYLSARCVVTARACAFRERMLEWLPGHLETFTLGRIRLGYLAEVYMHCSYASGPNKHRIKADLIGQMRKVCIAQGARDMTEPPPPRAKPRIVVVCEHFRAGHSVYRTHSRAVRSLRERFEVIGVGNEQLVDEDARACFDEMIVFPGGDFIASACEVADRIRERAPDIVFHLGVGMSNYSIALATLRLAPIQCVSYGHTATTMSPVMDYMILPDDFVGAEEAFTERVLRLPPEAIPYAPPAAIEPEPPPRAPLDLGEGVLRIAIPASVMKLNAEFHDTLARIAAAASRPVEFHFFPLAAIGLAHHYLQQEIAKVVPGAVVHAQSPRNVYLERLGACAFFLCPFPYGNMNSIIDSMLMGIPGVCLDGAEAHSHADVAIFHRLGLPASLAAATPDAYVAAAVRLIDDPRWLTECRAIARDVDLDQRFYNGDERLFCAAMYALLPGQTDAARKAAKAARVQAAPAISP
jgi:hypothetical protein